MLRRGVAAVFDADARRERAALRGDGVEHAAAQAEARVGHGHLAGRAKALAEDAIEERAGVALAGASLFAPVWAMLYWASGCTPVSSERKRVSPPI